jgi:predicted regulator of Ras-like GTPase activity (Roadblock/LC7/MglB family)
MRTDMFQQSLEDLNGSTADIEASALISTDGLMIASALPNGHGRGPHRCDVRSPALSW